MAGQQYQEGQHLQGSDGNVYVVRGGVPVLAQQAQSPGIVVKDSDPRRPFEAPLAQSALDKSRVSTETDRALLPYAGRKAAADTAKAEAEARLATIQAAQGGPNKGLSPEVRKDAINGYGSAVALRQIVKDLEAKYKAGPGATHGVGGLADYLPLTENQQFDAAGNKARGFVGTALGFTGGQLNTAQEANQSVGPYLPQSGDRDAVILDKIESLRRLADQAETKAIQVLGGRPDANGNVTPITKQSDQRQPVTGALPPHGLLPPGNGSGPLNKTSTFYDPSGGPQGGGLGLAGGQYKTEFDPKVSAQLDGMIRSGLSPDRINAALASVGRQPVDPKAVLAAQEYLRQHPDFKGSFANATNSVLIDNPGLNAFQQSAPGVFADQFSNAATFGNKANLSSIAGGGNADLNRGGMEMAAQGHQGAALAGNLAGGATAAGGLELGLGNLAARAGIGATPWVARGADALYGGLTGASENPDNPLGGAVIGGVAGLGGGMFGRAATRGAGNALTGVRNESVQLLKDRGVPMTVGQILGQSGRVGSAIKGIEDRLAGLPLVGDVINARRREGVQGFNSAAFNEGMAPIGGTVPNVGERGIDEAGNLVSGAYGKALNGVQVTPDPQFSQELSNALGLGSAIPRTGQEFSHIVDTKIAPHFNSPTGAIDGSQIQDILQTVRGTNFGRDAMGGEANNALSNVGGAVGDLVGRQSPGTIPGLKLANTGYRNLNILGDAVGRGANTEGLFTPAQLGMAARSNAKKYGGALAAASEDRPFFDLQRAGQQVLPNKVPDSGTAGRLAMLAVPGLAGAAGGGVGYAAGDAQTGGEAGIATLAALAAGGSKTAQKMLAAAMLNRPANVIRAGEALGARARYGGMFGAGASPMFLPPQ